MRPQKTLAGAAALSSFLLAGIVHAQQTDQDICYQFIDDSLVGTTLSSPPPLLVVRPASAHVTLIRPRASFVGELLESVETL